MGKLKDEVKVFIVQQLACYKQPQEICDLVKETYKVSVTRPQVFFYHPDQGKVSEKLRVIFDVTRKKFLETVADIPIANQAVRLQTLQKLLDNQMNNGRGINQVMVLKILQQAAEEVGGMFTNQRVLMGKDGKPLFETPVDMARKVFEDLLKEGHGKPDVLKFVAERYNVPEAALISNASN